MVEDQRVAHGVLVETIGRLLGVFYSNDVMVGSYDLDWLQHAINFLVSIFKRYDLVAKIVKSHTMTFRTRSLQAGMLKEIFAQKCKGVGDSY